MLLLSIRNILHKPLDSLLSFGLFTLGIAITIVLLISSRQFNEQLERNTIGVDIVLGAKGSPLQLILSSMYHIDAPTGNISAEEAGPFLNPEHPLFTLAVPLALGDSYHGFRLVGTNAAFDSLYQLEIMEGRNIATDFEVVFGPEVAEMTGLTVGDSLVSAHGLAETADDLGHTDARPFVVTGIYKETGTVADRLVKCSIGSIHKLHGHSHEIQGVEPEEEDITAVLLRFRNKTSIQSLNFVRNINENTNMMAAAPSYEMSRLYAMLGVGTDAIRTLAIVLILASALSIFLTMWRNLRERQYDLALIRVMGGKRRQVFLLVIYEAIVIAFAGAVAGIVLGHIGMGFLGGALQSDFGYAFTAGSFYIEEVYVFLVALAVGALAALIPAVVASRRDVHEGLVSG